MRRERLRLDWASRLRLCVLRATTSRGKSENRTVDGESYDYRTCESAQVAQLDDQQQNNKHQWAGRDRKHSSLAHGPSTRESHYYELVKGASSGNRKQSHKVRRSDVPRRCRLPRTGQYELVRDKRYDTKRQGDEQQYAEVSEEHRNLAIIKRSHALPFLAPKA